MLSDLTMTELNAAIHKIKPKKVPGKDGILNDMIKHLGPTARQKLLLIINQSWKAGKFPDSWRETIIIPIQKKQKDKTKQKQLQTHKLAELRRQSNGKDGECQASETS
eukprot:TRINITY_DN51104_c0_g1_i10.p1 TRINITY_DN51104_c0_g1~~TRINITY_DN51104_c0_g1_i10.p1  ORF type:complete len:108 (-),score=23.79 TRINITY_DN51104_c0_g1_i10:79-402(-)